MRALFRSISLAASVVCLFSLPGGCQAKAAAGPDYSAESFVFDRIDTSYTMSADGTGVCERTVAAKIQSEAALREFGVLSVSFASSTQHMEFVYVRVRRPDGTVTETPVSGEMDQPSEVTRQAPFYSDLKDAQLPVKNLQVGDTLEWKVRVVTTRSEAPGQFWGSEQLVTEGAVVREESMELRVPAAKDVIVWTNPKLGVEAVETASDGMKVYRWESAALKPTVGAAADAEKKAAKTRLLTADEELDNEQGKLPSMAWTTFKSWAEVGSWFRGLEDGRAVPDEELKAKVAEIVAGKTSEEDKVRAVYAYVSTQIRYIGVAFGVGRYQPHEAVDVLHNQYGDCKDKATLLTAMLAAIGEPSDVALIGAGVRFNKDVPSPAAFNHAITHLKLNGQDVWLDSTEEIAPYRMMWAELRDRTALVVPATGDAVLEKTPKDPPFASLQTWTSKGALDKDGVSDSHISFSLRGDAELLLRAAVRTVSPAQYDELAQKLFNNIGYSGTVSHADISRPDDTSGPLVVSIDYHRVKAGDWDNLRTVPQLAPVDLPMVDENDPPVASIDLGTPRTNISDAEMKLPAGWRAELPETVHEKTAFATYDETYRFENGTLYSERKYVVLQKKVPASDWKNYKKWQDAANLGGEAYVQLIRGGSASEPAIMGGTGSGPKIEAANPGPTVDDHASDEELIKQAMTMVHDHLDAAEATALLDRVKAKNPKQRGLWVAYGYVAEMKGMPNEALDDFRKELTIDPDNTKLYPYVAARLQARRDKAGALEVMRQWVSVDGGNPQAATELSQMLLRDKKAAEALAMLNKSMGSMSEDSRKDPRLQLQLGSAQVEAGKREEGKATLLALLDNTDDPEMLNDAAYELADAGLALPVDEAKEQVALSKLEAETSSWTMDESPATLKAKTSLLAASWDTMGWILFREQKFSAAKSYIEAAYLNGPNDEVRSHLEKVNSAMGVIEKKAGMAKAGVTVNGTPPEEQQVRTIPLGAANGRTGVAEFKMLWGNGRIVRLEAVGKQKIDGGEEMVRKMELARYFPEGSQAKLYHLAILNCYGATCQLVLEP